MCEIRNRPVIEAVQRAAQAHGLKALAPMLDKKPSTLYAELNPWSEPGKAKLGFDDALEIMRITDDFAGLELAASALGFRLVRKDPVPGGRSVAEELGHDTQRLGEWARIVMDPDATEPEVRLARQALAHEADETEALKIEIVRAQRERKA